VSAGARPLAGRRVLILVENLPVPLDRRVWQEAGSLRDAGAEVAVICPAMAGWTARRELRDGVLILRYPQGVEAEGALGYLLEYGWALACQFWLSLRLFRERGFDAVQACNPPDLMFLVGGFWKLAARRRFVFDHHDLGPELYVAKFGRRGPLHRLLLALERWTYACADVAIVTNDSFRRIALDRCGMAPERVFIVRSCPDPARFRPAPPRLAARRGRAHAVGWLGVMGAQDGVRHVLEAARIVCAERDDVQFLLIGDGTERAALEALAAALGLGERASFTGFLTGAELLETLSAADLCVSADEPGEMNDKSTMNKVLEYMALAKPVVAFDLAETRASAADCALYAAPGDAAGLAARILELLDDPARRAAMGAAGRARIERELSWPNEAPKLVAAYASLWSGR